MEHLLSMLTMSDQEIIDVLDLADKIKAEVKQGVFTPYLKNKTIGLIFQKLQHVHVFLLKLVLFNWVPIHFI